MLRTNLYAMFHRQMFIVYTKLTIFFRTTTHNTKKTLNADIFPTLNPLHKLNLIGGTLVTRTYDILHRRRRELLLVEVVVMTT